LDAHLAKKNSISVEKQTKNNTFVPVCLGELNIFQLSSLISFQGISAKRFLSPKEDSSKVV
jgi:hypothetical protein